MIHHHQKSNPVFEYKLEGTQYNNGFWFIFLAPVTSYAIYTTQT
jgi:hypothetical protein